MQYVITLGFINKNTSRLQTKSDKRVWGDKTPREGKGAKGLRKKG
jgi:hypothetical protein